ncbi:hypothetical protein ACXO52_09375, partial [Lactobacillus delbrueckii subsp. bulgaricus]
SAISLVNLISSGITIPGRFFWRRVLESSYQIEYSLALLPYLSDIYIHHPYPTTKIDHIF